MCAVFWGVVLVLIGAAALLPHDLSRYVWPIVDIGAGAWLLFGPLYWYWERPYDRYDEPADWE
jgi:dolichol kinase